jgi:DDE family transposase
MRRLHDEVVKPIATLSSRGAWYRKYRLVSLDESTLDVADEAENDEVFGRPGSNRGSSAYPQIRFVSLVENGTHVLFGSHMADYGTGEITLAKAALPSPHRGMLCLADRQFFGFELWNLARTTGADPLWRIKKNMRLAREEPLLDGSYLSHIHTNGIGGARPTGSRSASSTIPWTAFPTLSQSTASSQRFPITTKLLPSNSLLSIMNAGKSRPALDELKTHLRGAKIVLRSRTPDLVRQEFFELMRPTSRSVA